MVIVSPPRARMDAAKEARRLLDIFEEMRNISGALIDFKNKKRKVDLSKVDERDLDSLIQAINIIYKDARRQTVRVSPLSHLLSAYDKIRVNNKENEVPLPYHSKSPVSTWKVTEFIKKSNNKDSSNGGVLSSLPKVVKEHCRRQFQPLMKIQFDCGQISYPEMLEKGIPKNIDRYGNELDNIRPSGAHAEHRQPAKTINAEPQKRMREEKRRTKMAKEYGELVVEQNTISDILQCNALVETELNAKVESGNFCLATVADFFALSPASKLENFIHVRKFNDKTFQKSKLAGADGKLNKVSFRGQKPDSIEEHCSEETPCLVWLAWKLRSSPVIMKRRSMPILKTTLPQPVFTVFQPCKQVTKLPSEYLRNPSWTNKLTSVVKGVRDIPIDEELMRKADALGLLLEPRLDQHIAERVHESRHNHWTIRFTRNNISPMAAAMCLVGHIVDDIECYNIAECLLMAPMDESFQVVAGNLSSLEGCYLYFDKQKKKWIRSGKTSGEGIESNFEGRGATHVKNSKSRDQMRIHPLSWKYPSNGVPNFGAREGFFQNLTMYCAMAYDKMGDLSPLYSHDQNDSLFVWNKETMSELEKRGGDIQKFQQYAIAYLWEIFYDLLLAKGENVSVSPGFEALGLRVNAKKRSRDEFHCPVAMT